MLHPTICLPTRNRPAYCIETIKALAEGCERDFEVIVADKSDEPAPLADFLTRELKYSRFRLFPAPGRCFPWSAIGSVPSTRLKAAGSR